MYKIIYRTRRSPREGTEMARYDIPQNVGKVRVAMFLGNKYVVWNGKQGKHEVRISCRDKNRRDERG